MAEGVGDNKGACPHATGCARLCVLGSRPCIIPSTARVKNTNSRVVLEHLRRVVHATAEFITNLCKRKEPSCDKLYYAEHRALLGLGEGGLQKRIVEACSVKDSCHAHVSTDLADALIVVHQGIIQGVLEDEGKGGGGPCKLNW